VNARLGAGDGRARGDLLARSGGPADGHGDAESEATAASATRRDLITSSGPAGQGDADAGRGWLPGTAVVRLPGGRRAGRPSTATRTDRPVLPDAAAAR
jgi:hypothetical protein